MRENYQRILLNKINRLRRHERRTEAPMAFLHHELSAENVVIPFSLSLPASHIRPALPPFRWSSPRDEYRSPRSPELSRQHLPCL
ncbi:hypothetical protein [Pseudomonas sp. 31 R 17]|nr:hypothetical protein [Pseudomonas sp. 31 R 17]